jgi:hypothetical protein
MEVVALNELAEAYRLYSIANKRPPRKLADLIKVEMIGGNAVPAVKSGDVILQYGAVLPDTNESPGDGTATEVLAYVRDVPERGGHVLMLDRTIRKMTPEEFRAAPKAGAK